MKENKSAVSGLFLLCEYPCMSQEEHDSFYAAIWNVIISQITTLKCDFHQSYALYQHYSDYDSYTAFNVVLLASNGSKLWSLQSLCTWYYAWMSSNLFYIVCRVAYKSVVIACAK